MQYPMRYDHVSDDEVIKAGGLVIDLDEIARKGGMSKEEKNIAKWYGIYSSRQAGNHMARIVIPGGVISSIQARNIAAVSEKYAQGRLNITTRQAIQLHWLKVGNLANMIRELSKEGNTTKHGCGDVTRIIASCPLAETCRYRRLNVRPYAQKTQKYLGEAADLNDLPRKFKITYSGCPAGCAQPYINCVGVVGVQREVDGKPEVGFEVVIGGGMGWKPFVAQKLFTFVPENRILQVCRAVALLFRDHGDRFNRAKSRLKFVVDKYGIEKCRDIIIANLKQENVDIRGIEHEPITETGVAFPDRPLTEEDPIGTDGNATVRAIVPMGELDFVALRRLAELTELYGDQKIYTTNRQNIELKGIQAKDIPAVKKEIEKLGFGTGGSFGLRDIVPCVGTTYCPKAVSTTRDLYKAVMEVVSREKYRPIEKQAVVNITGCPNSCSPYRIADIGFRGMRIREELGSVEGYEILIGGRQNDFGRKLGEFKFEDCAGVVEKVLDHFIEINQDGETLTDCVRRVGIDAFKEAVFHAV